MTGTRHFFDAIVSSADVVKGKPDPEVYFAAAARLGVPIRRCVVVEDAPEAIRGSMQAGISTVALGHGGNVSVASLDELAPDAFDGLVPA